MRANAKRAGFLFGGWYRTEIEHGAHGWHPHIHAIADSRMVNVRTQLSPMWERARRDPGGGIDIRKADARAVFELAKYVSKPSHGMTDGALVEYVQHVRARRMIATWGTTHGLKWRERESSDDDDGTWFRVGDVTMGLSIYQHAALIERLDRRDEQHAYELLDQARGVR